MSIQTGLARLPRNWTGLNQIFPDRTRIWQPYSLKQIATALYIAFHIGIMRIDDKGEGNSKEKKQRKDDFQNLTFMKPDWWSPDVNPDWTG